MTSIASSVAERIGAEHPKLDKVADQDRRVEHAEHEGAHVRNRSSGGLLRAPPQLRDESEDESGDGERERLSPHRPHHHERTDGQARALERAAAPSLGHCIDVPLRQQADQDDEADEEPAAEVHGPDGQRDRDERGQNALREVAHGESGVVGREPKGDQTAGSELLAQDLAPPTS